MKGWTTRTKKTLQRAGASGPKSNPGSQKAYWEKINRNRKKTNQVLKRQKIAKRKLEEQIAAFKPETFLITKRAEQ